MVVGQDIERISDALKGKNPEQREKQGPGTWQKKAYEIDRAALQGCVVKRTEMLVNANFPPEKAG